MIAGGVLVVWLRVLVVSSVLFCPVDLANVISGAGKTGNRHRRSLCGLYKNIIDSCESSRVPSL
jgi:hypothetical protein